MTLAPPEPLERPDPPAVVGVSGGVGTSTLAVALGGRDLRIFAGRPADVVVCRTTVESIVMAGRVAALIADLVIAVTAVDAAKPSHALTSRLQLLEPHVAAVVLVPHVPHWRDVVEPLEALRRDLTAPADGITRTMRRYVEAVATIQAALLGSAGSTRAVRS